MRRKASLLLPEWKIIVIIMGAIGELARPVNLLLLAAIAIVAFQNDAQWIGLVLGVFAMVLMSTTVNADAKRKREHDTEIYEEGVDADVDDGDD